MNQQNEETVQYMNCPFCGQIVPEQTDKCQYCGHCLKCAE